MRNNLAPQVVCAAVIALASLLLVNPMHIWMPDDVHMLMLGGVVVLAGIFAAFVLAEGRADEREEAHQAFAGRIAFLAGVAVLATGIAVQTFGHTLDAWLVAALVLMIIAKVAARAYANMRK